MLRSTPAAPKTAPPSGPPSGLSSEELRRYDLLLAGLDLLDQAIAVFDATPKLVTWNKAMLRLLDFPEKMVRVGTPFEEFARFNAERGEYGEGDVDALVAERMAAARAFLPHYVERERPNGKILAIRGVPIPNLGFVSLWTDITEQHRAQEVIERQNAELEARVRARTAELESANAEIDEIAAALRLSEERLKLIIDSIPALIAYVGRDEIYQFANRGYAEWFGLAKDEIVGRTIESVFGPEIYPVVAEQLKIASTGERVSYEYSRRLDNGRLVHARSAIVPELSPHGEVVGYFVLSSDITEQKANEAALIQAQKMEAVGQLTGGLAHDFNNLLTIIIGNLTALQAKLPADQPRGEHLDPALHAARRGAELIRRLLAFSRGQGLTPTAVETGALVLDMAELLRRSLTGNIRLHTRLPPEPLHAFVDPHQLENALLNLALNARDAMPDGGELTIAIAERRITERQSGPTELPAGDYVQFDVLDTGSGIAPELLPRLFEPFFTTKPFGRGSGLGLAMVYGFVRQSGGNIRVRSKPGAGTRVTFVLPRVPAPTPQAAAIPAPARVARPLAGPVLLVEDDPEVRRIVRLQLTALGHPVIEAADGAEAWSLLQAIAEIALLVTDTVMPGELGGRELVARTRAARPELPILMITGYAGDGAPGAAAQPPEPGVPVLRKPFDQETLAASLATLFDPSSTTGDPLDR